MFRSALATINRVLFTWSCSSFFMLLFSCAPAALANQPDYIKTYHPLINQAELYVVEGKYAEALQAYRQAFTAVPTAFARDYYNAAVCAALLQQEKQAVDYLKKLARKGVSLAYLEQQQVFDTLQTSRQWRKFKRKYPRYRHKFEQSANLDLRADLDELYARDQYFRQAAGSLRVYRDTLQQIEAQNLKMLLQWIETYGYPGEELIGVADTLEQLPRYSIVIERQTRARKGYDFTSILTEAVRQGRIAPQPAAYLLDQQAGQSKYGTKAFVRLKCSSCKDSKQRKVLKRYMEEKREKHELEQLDANRQQLGLEPMGDYKKKVLYALRDPRFKMLHAWSVKQYNVPSQEAAEVLMEGLTVAE